MSDTAARMDEDAKGGIDEITGPVTTRDAVPPMHVNCDGQHTPANATLPFYGLPDRLRVSPDYFLLFFFGIDKLGVIVIRVLPAPA